jgi:hypothetical protein
MGLYAGGCIRDAMARSNTQPQPQWLHDIHEFIAEYGIIDPALQALGCEWEQHYLGQCTRLSTERTRYRGKAKS